MAKQKFLARSVYAVDPETGDGGWFHPGDDETLPEWFWEVVTNPKAWVEEGEDVEYDDNPVAYYHSQTVKELQKESRRRGVDLSGTNNRKDAIVERLLADDGLSPDGTVI